MITNTDQLKLRMTLHLSLTDTAESMVYEDITTTNVILTDSNNFKSCRKVIVDSSRAAMEALYCVKLPEEVESDHDERSDRSAG